ncbi:hypothetical protein [Novosphingobium sp. EMRT-2]|uniref:hypothetical protein n=1 Tax=Novosphingobium sp. EMRT-2 TaxID=2571749 RepID=UPI0010BCFE79|nr:hypothetical protein [Novosphingobium sp. EMRT-2]QCI92637.1 hypothetical protein FA702_03075 [Novosphingobium sp. EMRT-2]
MLADPGAATGGLSFDGVGDEAAEVAPLGVGAVTGMVYVTGSAGGLLVCTITPGVEGFAVAVPAGAGTAAVFATGALVTVDDVEVGVDDAGAVGAGCGVAVFVVVVCFGTKLPSRPPSDNPMISSQRVIALGATGGLLRRKKWEWFTGG